jgi:hypothetical protein
MVTEAGVCRANIEVDGVGSFQIAPLYGVHAMREIENFAPSRCETVRVEFSPFSNIDIHKSVGGQGNGRDGANDGSCDDGSIVDIVVLYTPFAKNIIGNDIETQIDQWITYTNGAYANSQITPLQLRCLYKAEVSYQEASSGGTDLDRMHNPWDGYLDQINAIQNALRPDLVTLIAITSGVAGISEELGPFGVEQGQTTLFAHETGHNFGCAHDRAFDGCTGNCNCTIGTYCYSFAYCFTAGGLPHGHTLRNELYVADSVLFESPGFLSRTKNWSRG